MSRNEFLDLLFSKELEAHMVLDDEIQREDIRLKKQCQINSLQGRDHNTSFFYALVQIQKVNRSLSLLNINGHATSQLPTIRQHVMDFY